MSKAVKFSSLAWEQYRYWQANDRKTVGKINRLIDDIDRTGNDGIGKPEPLAGDLSGYWSRRINEKDRLIYSFDDTTVNVLSCRFHYGDK